ncbi:T9SS type B sorting domain-containing protein [Deminuibacter soli]|uniref:T9SS type B sorting domain-containing protein n=1 Tax=Deminuibacter soli TaxID=2291815 RepID=UPI0011C121DD|nr:gliding motility-associated C-terminal domain-containing protein [Deminuibacter soli]
MPPDIILGGEAVLTAQSGIDVPGDGWLRLSSNTTYKSGYCYINESFPSTLGVLAEFEFSAWKNNNPGVPLADGFSVFLFDANYGPGSFGQGNVGGSLGYAFSKTNTNGGAYEPALTGGYIGVGLDEFGSWSSTYQGQVGGLSPSYGSVPNAIALRGPASDSTRYLSGTQANLAGTPYAGKSLAYPTITATRPQSSLYYRKVQVLMERNGATYQVSVRLQMDESGAMQTVFGPVLLSTPPPPNLKLGFAASTGGATAFHEVRNVRITTPGGVRTEKSAPILVTNNGALTYQVRVYNDAGSAQPGIPFTDSLPAGFSYQSISFNNAGYSNSFDAGATTVANGVLQNNTLSLQAHSYGIITIQGTMKLLDSTTTQLRNIAMGHAPPGFTDEDSTNNTTHTITYRIPAVNAGDTNVCSQSAALLHLRTMAGATLQWTVTTPAGVTGALGGSGVADATGNYQLMQTLVNNSNAPQQVIYTITPSYTYALEDGTMLPAIGVPVTRTVTVSPIPVLTGNTSPDAVCSGSPFNYTITSNNSNVILSWKRAAVYGISNAADSGTATQISEILIDTLPVTVNAVYQVTASSNGCSATQQVVVPVNPVPVFNSNDTFSVCSGSAMNYAATSNVAGATFQWQRDAVPGIANAPGSGGLPKIEEVLINTTNAPVKVPYHFTVHYNNCSSTHEVIATVNPMPVLSSALQPPAICNSTSFTYIPTSETAGAGFSWVRDAAPGITNPAAAGTGGVTESLVNTGTTPATAIYRFTIEANGCSTAQNVSVQVQPAVNVNSLNNQTLCDGQTTTQIYFTGNAVQTDFSWTNTQPAIGVAASGSGDILPFTAANTTGGPIVALFTVTPSANGCIGSAQQFSITVNPLPVISSVVAVPPGSTLPIGTPVTITANINGATTYQWYKGNSIIAGATANTYTIASFQTADIGLYTIQASSSAGCSIISDEPVNLGNAAGYTLWKTVTNDNGNTIAAAGDVLTYTIHLKNEGSAVLSGMTILDSVAAFTGYVTGSIQGGASNNVLTNAGRTYLVYQLADVQPGATTTVQFKVKVADNVTGVSYISNMAVANGGGLTEQPSCPEHDPACTGDSTRIAVTGKALLNVVKTANRYTVNIGDTVIFTIRVSNNGTKDTAGITIRDIAAGFTYINDNGGGSYNIVSHDWQIAALAVGASRELQLTMQATADGVYRNIAVGGTLDPVNPENPQDTLAFPAIQITKQADKQFVNPGDTVVFTIAISNTGSVDTSGVQIKELPDGFTYISDDGAGTYNNISGIWQVATLQAGARRMLHITMLVNATGAYRNIAVGGSLNPDDKDNPRDTVALVALQLTKTAGRNDVQTGDTVLFTLSMRNNGTKDTTNVLVHDIADGLTYVQHTGDGSYNPATGIWTISNLPAGATQTIQLAMKVGIEGPYSNIAVGGTLDPSDPGNPVDTVRLVSLQISKTASRNEVHAGDSVVFAISISNHGAKDTSNVQVKELPDGFTYISDDGAGAYNAETGIWTTNVPAGATAVLHITMKAAESGLYRNVAVGGNFDTTDAHNPKDSIELVSLQLIKTANRNSVSVGDTVTFAITLVNHGVKDTIGVQIKDIPDGFSYIDDDGGGTFNPATGIWTTHVAGLSSAVLHLQMLANSTGTYRNIVVGGNLNPNDLQNPCDTVSLASLHITKTANVNNVQPGDTVIFTIQATNNGAKDTSGVQIKEIPDGFSYVGDDGAGAYNASTSIWTVNIPAGASRSLHVSFLATSNGTYSNIAVAGTLDPGNKNNPQDTALLVALQLTKTADRTAASAGDTVLFTIMLSNHGLKDTMGVQVKDIPTGFTYISDDGGGTYNPVSNIWTIDAGAQQTYLLHLKMMALPNAVYNNIVVGGSLDPHDPHNPQDTVLLSPQVRSLQAWKQVADASGNGVAELNELLNYTIFVKNTGTAILDTIYISDVLPSQVTYITGSGTNGNYAYDSSSRVLRIDQSHAALSPGNITSFGFTVRVVDSLPTVTTISNLAYVMPGSDDNGIATCASDAGCSVMGDSTRIPIFIKTPNDLAVVKKSEEKRTGVSDVFNYTITVTNKLNSPARDVMVTDSLPASVTYQFASAATGEASYSQSNRVLHWSIPEIAAGASVSLVLTVKANAAGDVVNTAWVSSQGNDLDTTDNHSSDKHNVIDLFIPNIITPNSDGKNDQFKITGIGAYPNSVLVVYNRWGNQVFYSSDYHNEWDGAGLNEGTYYYVLKLRTPAGTKDYKGWVTLMR